MPVLPVAQASWLFQQTGKMPVLPVAQASWLFQQTGKMPVLPGEMVFAPSGSYNIIVCVGKFHGTSLYT